LHCLTAIGNWNFNKNATQLARKRQCMCTAQLAVTEQGNDTQNQAQPTTSEVSINLREPVTEYCD